jgi:cysteine sulfinate desulfinase/cysteine desulfurase-like protein
MMIIPNSGTLPAPLVVGLGAAVDIAAEEMANDKAHIERLAKKMNDAINAKLEDVRNRYYDMIRFHLISCSEETVSEIISTYSYLRTSCYYPTH